MIGPTWACRRDRISDKIRRHPLIGLLACWIACSSVHGQTRLAQQDLYLDAMQSIAEGRKTDASQALTRMVEQEPQHAGAWLDLAIIQCELGHANEAQRLFHIIETRFSPPPGIMEVIARQRAQGCTGWQPHQHLLLTTGRGTDSNINQGASDPNFSLGNGEHRIDLQLLPQYLPAADRYTFLLAEYARDISRNGSTGFIQWQAHRNDTASAYDTMAVTAGMEVPWRFAQWSVHSSGMLGALTLGNRLYQQQSQLQARITPVGMLANPIQWSLVTGLSHVAYPTLTDFDTNTAELRGLLTYRTDRLQGHASLGVVYDHALGARPGGDRQGWYASTQVQTRLAEKLLAEFSWTAQTWTGRSPYSPGLIDQSRHQQTRLLRAAVIVPLAERHSLRLEWRQVQNQENISIFQYNNRQLQLSWQWQIF